MYGTDGTAQMAVCEANVNDVFGKSPLLMVLKVVKHNCNRCT